MYYLSTQWENIDLLSLTHLISCVGDSAFHLSPWQRKWENTAAASFSPVMKQWSIADFYHIWKTSLWAGMNVFITHGVSLALVSSASICKKPTFDSFLFFLSAKCAAAWELCSPTIPLWFYGLVKWDLALYLQCWPVTAFLFVCNRSSLKQSAAAASVCVSQVITRAPYI